MLYTGYSQVDITPTGSVQTVGFGRPDEHSQGVEAPLFAAVCVLALDNVKCALITIDHIGYATEHANKLRSAVARELDTTSERVMLCFSHTHSAPNDSLEPGYAGMCDKLIITAARAANGALSPSKAVWLAPEVNIGLNRRADSVTLDKRAGILKITDYDGKNKLLILRLTAHANVLKADNFRISPDYFGEVRRRLSSEHGCPVMLTQGASGNVAPRFFNSRLTPPDAADDRFIRTEGAFSLIADLIASACGEAIIRAVPEEITALDGYCEHVTLKSDVPTLERAQEVADEAERYCGIKGTGWSEEVERLNAAGIREQETDVELQYLSVGGGCLCGVCSEIMCEFALESAARTGNELFFFGGYTNGCTGYFPTPEEFDKGGFEVYWSMLIYYMYYARVFPFRRDEANTLIDAAVKGYRK